MEKKLLTVRNFAGLNDKDPPTRIKDNEASEIKNIILDKVRGAMKKANGYDKDVDLSTHPTIRDPIGSYVFKKGTDETFILQAVNTIGEGHLYTRGTEAIGSGAYTDLHTLPLAYWPCSFAAYLGKLYVYQGLMWETSDLSTITEVNNASSIDSANEQQVPIGYYLQVHKNRLWIAGLQNARNTVMFSSLPHEWKSRGGNGNMFWPEYSFDVNPDDGDSITGIFPFQNALLVFKRNSIAVIHGGGEGVSVTGLGDFAIDTVRSDVGCIHFRTIQYHEIDKVGACVVFAAEDGVYALTGFSESDVIKISEPIDNTYTNVVKPHLRKKEVKAESKEEWDEGTYTDTRWEDGCLRLDYTSLSIAKQDAATAAASYYTIEPDIGYFQKFTNDIGYDTHFREIKLYMAPNDYPSGKLKMEVRRNSYSGPVEVWSLVSVPTEATWVRFQRWSAAAGYWFGRRINSGDERYVTVKQVPSIEVHGAGKEVTTIGGEVKWYFGAGGGTPYVNGYAGNDGASIAGMDFHFEVLNYEYETSGTYTSKKYDGANPNYWGIFEAIDYHQDDAWLTTATYSMRSAATEGGIDSATWYEIDNSAEVSASVAVSNWFQFKVNLWSPSHGKTSRIDSYAFAWSGVSSLGQLDSEMYEDKYYLTCPRNNPDTPSTPATNNNYLLTYDKYSNWGVHPDYNLNCLTEYDDGLWGGDEDREVRVLDTSASYNGASIEAYYITKEYDMGHPGQNKTFYRAWLTTEEHSATPATLTVEWSIDGAAYVDKTISIYGTGIDSKKIQLPGGSVGKHIKFKIGNNSKIPFENHQLSVEYWVHPPT